MAAARNWIGGGVAGRIAALVLRSARAVGVAYTALFPICQIRVMKAAPQAQALAGTINVSAANAGIALGAVIGGPAILLWGVGRVGYIATVVAALAALTVPLVARLRLR